MSYCLEHSERWNREFDICSANDVCFAVLETYCIGVIHDRLVFYEYLSSTVKCTTKFILKKEIFKTSETERLDITRRFETTADD